MKKTELGKSSEPGYLRAATRLGKLLLAILVLMAIAGIYQGYTQAHLSKPQDINKEAKG